MNSQTQRLHPILLVVAALILGIVLNFGIWWVVYGAPPTTPAFYHSVYGCLNGRLEERLFYTLPQPHVPHALRDWKMNIICNVKENYDDTRDFFFPPQPAQPPSQGAEGFPKDY